MTRSATCSMLPLQAADAPDGEGALMISSTAGVIARTVSDVALFNSLFSDCQDAYPDVELQGLRMGYPTNFWADLGDEVSTGPCPEPQ